MTQPSGWYDDPDDPTLMRYWDGVIWTDRTSPKFHPGLDRSSIGSPQEQDQPGSTGTDAERPRPPQAGSDPNPYASPKSPPYGAPRPRSPYAYGPARPTTPDGQPLSGWWRRVVARIVDGIIVGIITVIVSYGSYDSARSAMEGWMDDVMQTVQAGSTQTPPIPDAVLRYITIVSLVSFVLYGLYEVLLLSRTGSTPGRRLVNISVRMRDQPGPPPMGAMLQRYLVKEGPVLVGLLPLIGFVASIFMLVNYLWPLWDADNQALHDKVAKTNVALGQQPRPGGERRPEA